MTIHYSTYSIQHVRKFSKHYSMSLTNINIAHKSSRKSIFTTTYQPLVSTCVELKFVLTVLLAYPHSSRSGRIYYPEKNIRPLEYFVALNNFSRNFIKHNPIPIITNLNSIKLAISKLIGIIEFRARLNRTHNSI